MKRDEFFWRDLGDTAAILAGWLLTFSSLACAVAATIGFVVYGGCLTPFMIIMFGAGGVMAGQSTLALQRHTKYYREERAKILGRRK